MIRYKKEELYEMQRDTFEIIIRRHHGELILEWKDLFATFWIDFVPYTGMSINKFLYADFGRRKLKRGFLNGG